MKRLNAFKPLVLGLVASTVLGSVVLAQPPGATQTNNPTMAVVDNRSRPGPVFSLEFPGGTVRQFVDAVRQAAGPDTLNILLPESGANVRLGPVSLRNVSATTALSTLTSMYASDPDNRFDVQNRTSIGDTALTFAVLHLVRNSTQASANAGEARTLRVSSLRDLTTAPEGLEGDRSAWVPVETVLSALKAAAELESQHDAQPPEFLYHKETSLLVVRGTKAQHELVASVLGELFESIRPHRIMASKSRERDRARKLEQITMKAELDQAEIQARRCVTELNNASERFDRVQKLLESGQASRDDLDAAKSAVAKTRSNVEQAESVLNATRARAAVVDAKESVEPAVADDDEVVVLYDVRDMHVMGQEFVELCRSIVPSRPGHEGIKVQPANGDSVGTWAVRATPDQHQLLVKVFNTIRRARANDPNLPGLNADELLEKARKSP